MDFFLSHYKPVFDSYENNYNITNLHMIILRQLREEPKLVPELENECQKLSLEVKQCRTLIAKENKLNEIRDKQKVISLIKSGDRVKNFLEETKLYIDQYQGLNKKINYVSFSEEEEQQDENLDLRLFLIDRYLSIAQKYYPLEIYRRNKVKSGVCKFCCQPLSNVINEEGIIVCDYCNTEHTNTSIIANFNLPTHVSSTDESKENFIRTLDRFEGLQTDRPPAELYEDLDRYFTSIGRPKGDYFKPLPVNEDRVTKGDTNHKMLWNALSKTGWSKYYEDANLIGHIYWGWVLPKIKNRELILQDYDKTQEGFYSIPVEKRGRQSSLGTQYRSYRHLQLREFPNYPIEMFKIAENSDSFITHDRLWAMMCEAANDPEIKFISDS